MMKKMILSWHRHNKEMAVLSRQGVAFDDRTSYLCMGVVKDDDSVPNWDTKAMEEGR